MIDRINLNLLTPSYTLLAGVIIKCDVVKLIQIVAECALVFIRIKVG